MIRLTAHGLAALLTLTLLLFHSAIAVADSPSFTYVELEYIAAGDFKVSDDQLSVALDMDGYALNASVELGIFLLRASRFELQTEQIFDANLKDSISTIAVGLTFELPRTSVYGLVRGRRDELSLRGGGFNEDEQGNSIGIEAGVRINITDRFEINANLGAPALDEGNSFGVGAQFYLTKNLGLTVDYSSIEIEDDSVAAEFDTTSIGLRYNF